MRTIPCVADLRRDVQRVRQVADVFGVTVDGSVDARGRGTRTRARRRGSARAGGASTREARPQPRDSAAVLRAG
jgi:hypothetical protein